MGSLLSSFLLAALTRDPDTEVPGLVDLLRLFLSFFSFSLRLFSFFFLLLDELLVDERLLSFFFFSSFALGVSAASLFGLVATVWGVGWTFSGASTNALGSAFFFA